MINPNYGMMKPLLENTQRALWACGRKRTLKRRTQIYYIMVNEEVDGIAYAQSMKANIIAASDHLPVVGQLKFQEEHLRRIKADERAENAETALHAKAREPQFDSNINPVQNIDIVADTQKTTGVILEYMTRMGVSPSILQAMSATRDIRWLNEKEAFDLNLATDRYAGG